MASNKPGETTRHRKRNIMSNTANATVTVTVSTTPKLTASIAALCDAQSTLEGKWTNAADTFRLEAASKGYTREHYSPMLEAAYTAAAEQMGKKAKLTGDALTAYVSDFVTRKAPDRSKILSLAFPKSDKAVEALAEAKAHNATATGTQKIGVNDQLRIARDKEGTTTVATILAERAEKAAAGGKKGAQNGGAPRVGGTTTTTTPSTFTRDQALEAFINTITSCRTIGKMSADDVDEIIAEAVAKFEEAAAEK